MNRSILNTKRIIIRPFMMENLEELVTILSDPDVTRFIGEPNDRLGIQERLKQWINDYNNDGYGFMAFFQKDSNQLIGYGGFIKGVLEDRPYIELGYCIGKAYWNQGYATEAAKALKEFGLKSLKFSEIYSIVSEGNVPSMYIAEKIGMKLLKTVNIEGHPYLCRIYSSHQI